MTPEPWRDEPMWTCSVERFDFLMVGQGPGDAFDHIEAIIALPQCLFKVHQGETRLVDVQGGDILALEQVDPSVYRARPADDFLIYASGDMECMGQRHISVTTEDVYISLEIAEVTVCGFPSQGEAFDFLAKCFEHFYEIMQALGAQKVSAYYGEFDGDRLREYDDEFSVPIGQTNPLMLARQVWDEVLQYRAQFPVQSGVWIRNNLPE